MFAESKEQAIFFRHAVEAPRVIWRVAREVEHFFHPMTAPGTGIEIWHDPEGLVCRDLKSSPEIDAADQFWGVIRVGIEQKINMWKEGLLEPIRGAPLDKITAFVLAGDVVCLILESQICEALCAPPFLYFPAGQVGVDEGYGSGCDERCAGADDNDKAAGLARRPLLLREQRGIKIVCNVEIIHASKDSILSEDGTEHRFEIRGRFITIAGTNDGIGREVQLQPSLDLSERDPRVAFDTEDTCAVVR